MVHIKNNGGLTIVRKVRKDGGARGTLVRSNIREAAARGNNNVVAYNKKTKG